MRFGFFFLMLATFISCSEKDSFRFAINSSEGMLPPVPLGLDMEQVKNSNVDLGSPIVLVQEVEGRSIEVPFQIDSNENKIWFVNASNKPDEQLNYRLENGVPTTESSKYLSEHKENGNLQLSIADKPVVQYRYEMTYPPEGVDSIFKKSGYIHPLLTLKGDTLTRIQPPDHYHHYGLWGPWTHTQIDGERVDFWNLAEGMGTVLFKEFKNSESGNVFSSFTSTQEHIDLKTKDEPQVALNEDLRVRLWKLGQDDRYMFDYTTTFSSPLKNGILFEAYRYGGGIGLRFNERWKADNCSVLTSEGKDRSNADGSNARWCIVTGEASDGIGTNGILFMSHPKNRMHPEPMRIWPLDGNGGRGDMFFEFCPIRHEEWKIEPNKAYGLNYRMIVFDGELTAEEAEAYWQAFAEQPEVTETKN
ncbi:MAG: PmoA family protein [Pricia sp.]|nr:PmoA family protein [Pricia sp.]